MGLNKLLTILNLLVRFFKILFYKRVPKNYPSAHLNLSKGVSRVLALADIAWRPNDDEMKNATFDDYDWSKWTKQE